MQRLAAVSAADREYMLFCLEFCGAVLARKPSHLEALSLAAGYYTELGYFADGLRVDRLLFNLRPDDPLILYNLACSLSLNGSFDAAFSALEKAVANGYSDYCHMQQDRDLLRLHNDPRFESIIQTILDKAAGAFPLP